MTQREQKPGEKRSPGRTPVSRGWRFAVLFVLALSVLSLTRCAYYNVLYNARLKYDEAQIIKKRADPEREEITSQEEKLYQEAFEKAAKVVKFYPDSKWVDDALLLMGKSSFEKGDHSTAIRKFDEILTFYPESNLLGEVLLMKGRTQIETKEYAEAREALVRANEISEKKLAGDISYFMGIVQHEEENTPAAKAAFLDVLENHEKSEWYGHAGMRLGRLAEDEGDLGGAVVHYEAAYKGGKTPEERFLAGMNRGEALLELGAYDAAGDAFEKLADKAFDDEKRGEARIKKGQVALAVGDTEEAIAIFQGILESLPRTNAAAEAQYQIGRIYDDTGDYERATAEYELVREQGTGNPAYGKAVERQAEIQNVLDLRTAIAAEDEAEKERKRFLLAEHLLEKIGDVDAALTEYSSLATDAHGTEWGARSLYAEAWIYENRLARPDTAETLLFQLANFYSGTEVSSAARRRFGFPVWEVEVLQAPPVVFLRADGEEFEPGDIVVTRVRTREVELPEGISESRVWVRVNISSAGTCEQAKLVRPGCPECDEAALEAARASLFLSAEEGGAAITVLQYEFPPPPGQELEPELEAEPELETGLETVSTTVEDLPVEAPPDTLIDASSVVLPRAVTIEFLRPSAEDSTSAAVADSLSAAADSTSAALPDSLSAAADSMSAAADSTSAAVADSASTPIPSQPAAVRGRGFELKRND